MKEMIKDGYVKILEPSEEKGFMRHVDNFILKVLAMKKMTHKYSEGETEEIRR